MNTADILTIAIDQLMRLEDHIFDVLSLNKPISPAAAVNLVKVISKLSPLLGNLIEFNTIDILNQREEFHEYGLWLRQDPGFPDALFTGSITPTPGIEIKTWFPLATEITARFKERQEHFTNANIFVVLVAWMPEYVIYGRPRILNIRIIEAGSIARARDFHYHNPPDYLVFEPETTDGRTRNLQQTNTNGYKWQDTPEALAEAKHLVDSWGDDGRYYQSMPAYQDLLRQLLARYRYRLDTNFAKIDRIAHPEIEQFKREVYQMPIHGMTVYQWMQLCNSADNERIARALATHLTITPLDADSLLK